MVRKIALRYLKEYATEELLSSPLPDNPYFEEKLCKAIFIGRAKIDEKERIAQVKKFLSCIDGWAICDGFCSELKTCKVNLKLYYPLIIKCFKEQSRPFTLRFACVMALMYFSDVKYEDEIVSHLNNINTEEYYVRMGVAWLIATLYTKNGPAVLDKVNNISLDDKTYNKALQKITESNYVSNETKAQIRKMKRKQFVFHLTICFYEQFEYNCAYGEMAEWLNASHSKCDNRLIGGSGVQIPFSPPSKCISKQNI